MRKQPSNPPYFDGLLQRLAVDEPDTVSAFGRHVHWGYWKDPSRATCSAADYGAAAEQLCRVVCDASGVRSGTRIVDVGCGFGGTLASLNERFSDLQLVGINIDSRQLQRATELVRPLNGNSIEFVRADAANIPLPSGTFDVVLAVECVFHFDRYGFFAEAARLLGDDGNLTLSDFVPSERAIRYMDGLDLSADEAIRWSYGDLDLTCSLSRYHELAQAHQLALCEAIDITSHTMPTYDFLYSSSTQWQDKRHVELFTRATRLLHKASRNGMIGYQILRLRRMDRPSSDH